MPGISPLPLEVLRFEAMASGAMSLVLTERISWDQFTKYADRMLGLLDGRVRSRADSPSERVWDVTIAGYAYWLSFNDFALGVSLDARDPDASAYLSTIRSNLERHRDFVHGTFLLPKGVQEKVAAMPESSYGATRVVAILDDGTRIRDVYVAWGREIVKVGHNTDIPFDPGRVVDVESS